MNGKYLLDTNIVVALFNRQGIVSEQISQTEGICVPNIVIGELYFGAEKSRRREQNIARINMFVHKNTILICDIETARFYGHTKNQLKQVGRPIPENDIWIAALAQQHQLTLVTRDKHFQHIDQLLITIW